MSPDPQLKEHDAQAAAKRKPDLLGGYLSEPELAEATNKTVRTLQSWRKQRIGPPFTLLGKTPIYPIDGFHAWLKSREIRMSRERK